MNEERCTYRYTNGNALLKELLLLLAVSQRAYQANIKQKIDRYPAVCVMFLTAFRRLFPNVFTGDLMWDLLYNKFKNKWFVDELKYIVE